MPAPRLKICGLRSPNQASAVAALGVDALGVIGVASSARFLAPAARPELFAAMRAAAPGPCLGVLVVANPGDDQLPELDASGGHDVIQLHGDEPPERCAAIRRHSGCAVWKAIRLRHPGQLAALDAYRDHVDALLLDAWVPDQLGGSGQAIPLQWLAAWQPPLPWWLAGGIRAERVPAILSQLQPSGLDASSGVERSPGDKDLARVQQLVEAVRGVRDAGAETGTPAG